MSIAAFDDDVGAQVTYFKHAPYFQRLGDGKREGLVADEEPASSNNAGHFQKVGYRTVLKRWQLLPHCLELFRYSHEQQFAMLFQEGVVDARRVVAMTSRDDDMAGNGRVGLDPEPRFAQVGIDSEMEEIPSGYIAGTQRKGRFPEHIEVIIDVSAIIGFATVDFRLREQQRAKHRKHGAIQHHVAQRMGSPLLRITGRLVEIQVQIGFRPFAQGVDRRQGVDDVPRVAAVDEGVGGLALGRKIDPEFVRAFDKLLRSLLELDLPVFPAIGRFKECFVQEVHRIIVEAS